MKTYLVTGADGFIGSHLAEFLVQQGHQVRALTCYNSFNSWGWLDDSTLKDKMEIVSGDVRDPHLCKTITKGIDCVFHLAALIAIPYSYAAPHSYIDTNVNGTANMCIASLENEVSRFIHTSTSEVYGTAQYVPINEKHPLQAQSPYSASKIGADAMATSFHKAFNLNLVVARPFNTYGPRQSARAVIPTIITQLLAGKKEIDLGDVTPTRDFNYVEDTVRGLYLLAHSPAAIGQTVNIGSNFEISIKETFEKIKKIIGSDSTLKIDPQRIRPANSEVFRLWCDNSLLKSLTTFSPEYSIDLGLESTVKWFASKDNLKKYKWNTYNV